MSNELDKSRRQNLDTNFKQIKEELDDHLDSINENTNEIQANYEYICELESKIDKLSERVDELTMFIRKIIGTAPVQKEPEYQIDQLTKPEKEVFAEIYALEQEEKLICYELLARRLALTVNLAQNYVTNLIEKGVPIVKRYADGRIYISLDEQFKAAQTRKNIIGLRPINA